MENKQLAYKGFNKDLTCRDYQYKEGETYLHKGKPVRCTESGFHSCKYPLDTFNYYEPASSVFHEVVISGDVDDSGSDTKICSAEITIGVKLDFSDMVKKSIDWVMGQIKDTAEENEDFSNSSNTGYKSAASNTGNRSAASNTGYKSAASNTGDYSAASNTGDYSAASNTGNRSAASNTGDYSAASVDGLHSVAMASGYQSKAKACKGSAIVLCYRNDDYELVHINAAIVDGEILKADTWYKLDENGGFVESE